PFIIHRFATLGSTNDALKQMADAPEFTCVVADEQTAGRGRRDRVWHSSPGDGLYLSILLRPARTSAKIPLLSLMTAVAVAETLIARGVDGVDIKWPNDVLVNERKLSGILIESIGANELRVVVGVGVNLNHQAFPEELRQTATSLKIETGQAVAVDEFRNQLLTRFYHWYECWKRGESEAILNRWQQLSGYARGLRVSVMLDHEQLTGETAGLNEDGALLLRTEDDVLRTILSGEVMRLRKRDAD
ncbi:MAG TPA: biotin--[acetyl-CoA-carboxylase] ligase, partial [Blastocatellia bacterium]|nr:biotin--[acetyl-CoA-carboxylase] ligase [Blastocatellia bacterium]